MLTLLKNIQSKTPSTTVSMVVATPKPRLIKLVITPRGTQTFSVAATSVEACHYVCHIMKGVTAWCRPLKKSAFRRGVITSFISRGFGVATTIDTVVEGVFDWIFFNSVSINPLATSGGNDNFSVISFSLPSSSLYLFKNWPGGSVERGVGRLFERRPALHKVILQ